MTTETHEGTQTFESPMEVHKTAEVMATGSLVETIAGVGGLVLAIIALAGLASGILAGVGAIVIGSALLLQGWAMGARYTHVVHETESGLWSTAAELGSGVMLSFVAGSTGIVLGLLTLLGMAETVLLPVVGIVFGGALILSSGATSKLNYLQITSSQTEERYHVLAREAVSAAAGLQVLFGLGAVVLGILALLHIQWMMLTLIGFLAVSTSVVLSGSALTGRFWGLWHRQA